MTEVDDAFRLRIEEAKYSLTFLFWWHYSQLRNRLRRRHREDARDLRGRRR